MTETLFSEVQAAPLSEVVLRVVREAIVEGRLAPGQGINQAELAKQLGVSRAPLREALRQLEKEGLVSHVPYRGTIVTPLTRRGVQELQSFRRLLELFAAERMLPSVRDPELDEFDAVVVEMERAARNDDLVAMNAADVKFHTRVIDLSGHDLLGSVWESYVQRIRRMLTMRNQANPNLSSIVQMHRDLVAAFRTRDIDVVRRAYDAHGADVAATLASILPEDDDLPLRRGRLGRDQSQQCGLSRVIEAKEKNLSILMEEPELRKDIPEPVENEHG